MIEVDIALLLPSKITQTNTKSCFLFTDIASSETLKQLMRFWTGWELRAQSLMLEVVASRGHHHLPTSSTCYERLRIPNHYNSAIELSSDLHTYLQSVETGFGLI